MKEAELIIWIRAIREAAAYYYRKQNAEAIAPWTFMLDWIEELHSS